MWVGPVLAAGRPVRRDPETAIFWSNRLKAPAEHSRVLKDQAFELRRNIFAQPCGGAVLGSIASGGPLTGVSRISWTRRSEETHGSLPPGQKM